MVALDESIPAGQLGHLADHEAIAVQLNALAATPYVAQEAHVISVKEYGDGVATGDPDIDTAAIQGTNDYAQGQGQNPDPGEGYTNVPIIYFPPGYYTINDTINKQAAPWIGAGANAGTRIMWEGPTGPGVVAIAQDTWSTYNRLSGISLHKGASDAIPESWLSFAGSINDLYYLDHVEFGRCSGDAILVSNGWVKGAWDHLRFNDVEGYAVRLTVTPAMTGRHFSFDHIHYGSSLTPASDGFLCVDNTEGVNAGAVVLDNARFELGAAWEGNNALITLLSGNNGDHRVNFALNEVQIVGGGAAVLYQDAATTGGAPSLSLRNFQSGALTAILGGDLPADFPTYAGYTDAHWASLDIGAHGGIGVRRTVDGSPHGLEIRRTSYSAAKAIRVYLNNESTYGTAIADATDAASAITQLNLALARLRTVGLIQT